MYLRGYQENTPDPVRRLQAMELMRMMQKHLDSGSKVWIDIKRLPVPGYNKQRPCSLVVSLSGNSLLRRYQLDHRFSGVSGIFYGMAPLGMNREVSLSDLFGYVRLAYQVSVEDASGFKRRLWRRIDEQEVPFLGKVGSRGDCFC